jgi:hypothetical protein
MTALQILEIGVGLLAAGGGAFFAVCAWGTWCDIRDER